MRYYAVIHYEWWTWYRSEDRLDEHTKLLVAVYLDSELAEKYAAAQKALGSRYRPGDWPKAGDYFEDISVHFNVYVQEGDISYE